MKWALVASVLVLSGVASAQTRLELNAEDHACTWKDAKGRTGTEICHITAQGTIMGETMMVFHIGDRKLSYLISDKEAPQLGYKRGDDWITVWTGKLLEDSFTNIKGDHATETIRLSDGMTIKIFR